MPHEHPLTSIGAIIELSVAPVFLLVAIGSFLNVVTQRLGRVVDRARKLEADIREGEPDDLKAEHLAELRALDRRMTFAHWAINFCSLAALLVAIVVALLFIGDLAGASLMAPVAVLFILATAGIIAGLSAFLAEIAVATRTVRVRSEYLARR